MDNNDTSFVKEIAKASLASGAISAATTAGFFSGILVVGVVIQKIADRKKK